MTKYKKKSAFIELKYTASFVMKFSMIAMMAFACLGLALFVLLNERLGRGYFEDISTLSGLQERLGTILIITGIFQGVLFSLIVFLLALLWAHAVAGPMVRFQKALMMLNRGELSEEISFRKDDQLHDLASFLTSLHRSCKARRNGVSEYLHKADTILEKCVNKGEELDINKCGQLNHIYYAMIKLCKGNK